nr:unnamed protein product [Naegleria fowleri]
MAEFDQQLDNVVALDQQAENESNKQSGNSSDSSRSIPTVNSQTQLNQAYDANVIPVQAIVTKRSMKCSFTVGEAITFVAWIIVIGFCIWYVTKSVGQFQDAQVSPSTSLALIETVPLAYPAVTICNWNAMYDCAYCNLTLLYATIVVNGSVIDVDLPYEYRHIEQEGQYFSCYVFNNNSDNPLSAQATGYGGTISLAFNVPPVPQDRDARFGLQVSFHEIGTTPNVFAETNFAVREVDNYFVLTKYSTIHLKPSEQFPDGVETVWASTLSTVRLTDIRDNVVVISFAYNTLNENKIAEIITYTLESLAGEVAGMIGMMMGIDALKMLRGILEVPYAIHQKSARGIWDVFN